MSKAAELANLIGNINAGSPIANKNLVHNGAMLVNQRGSSAITLSGLTPHIDRFTAFKSNGGAQTVEQSTDGPEGFKNSLKATNTTADASVASGDRVAIIYRCEGQHISHLEWGTANAKTLTLSFYVKSSITGTHGGAFGNGSDNRAYPFTYTISSADTWERKSITVAGDTTGTWAIDNTRSLQVCWGLGVGTTNSGSAGAWEAADRNSATGATTGFLTTLNATWFLTGVQLEIGQNATAFEHEPFAETLAKCGRYYQLIASGTNKAIATGPEYNSSTAQLSIDYPLGAMRDAPSIDQVNGGDYYLWHGGGVSSGIDGAFTIEHATTVRASFYATPDATVSSDGQARYLKTNNSAAYFAFKSEL